MNKEAVAAALPTAPRFETKRAFLSENWKNNLGGDFLIYKRESYAPADECDTGWIFNTPESGKKRHWAAKCACTACGERFWLGWVPEKKRVKIGKNLKKPGSAVAVLTGPDGTHIPGVPESNPREWDNDEYVSVYASGEQTACPVCEKPVAVMHYSEFVNNFAGTTSHTFRVRGCSVEIVQARYTALLFWEATRTVWADGESGVTVAPCGAVVIDDNRLLCGFSWDEQFVRWNPHSRVNDPFQCKIYSRSATSIYRRQIGGWCDKTNLPDLVNTTGEKSGIADFIRSGGEWPVMYLALWRKYPYVENLVKAGWEYTLSACLNSEIMGVCGSGSRLSTPTAPAAAFALDKPRPADMLHMNRKEVRELGPAKWDLNRLAAWREAVTLHVFAPGQAAVFDAACNRFGIGNVADFISNRNAPFLKDTTFEHVSRYLDKQEIGSNTLRLFLDYRRMLFNPDNPAFQAGITPDELFPRHLRAAHDRLTKFLKSCDDAKTAARFDALREKWKRLEFSDGKICALLPRRASDLANEGHTLHHCVGGYVETHLSGSLIIFIRHARRPERSWYTLNVRVTGPAPERVQLHGYRNDYINGRKIPVPKEVNAFIDKWERDVLRPAFYEVV